MTTDLYRRASDFAASDYLKALVYGNTGAGKTRLGASAKKPLILLGEPQGMRTIRLTNPDALVVHIDRTEKLREVVADLHVRAVEGTLHELCDTLVLDSLTEIQGILKREIIDAGGENKDSLTMGEWGTLIDKTAAIARTLRNLPIHVLVLCLAREEVMDTVQLIRPSVQGKTLPNDLAAFFNVVGYAYKRPHAETDPERDVSVVHRVLLQGPDRILTKGDPALAAAEVPSWATWVGKCYGANAHGAIQVTQAAAPDAEAEGKAAVAAAAEAASEGKQGKNGGGKKAGKGDKTNEAAA